jgi:hypothetical protein
MTILLGNFTAKVRIEDIFKPAIENESVHETSSDNAIRVVNFITCWRLENWGHFIEAHVGKTGEVLSVSACFVLFKNKAPVCS